MSAIADVIAERARQIAEEGYTAEHDDQLTDGELARAGAAYALSAGATKVGHLDMVHSIWPFDAADMKLTIDRRGILQACHLHSFKPSDDRRELVKGCALMLAEIERIDRDTERRARR